MEPKLTLKQRLFCKAYLGNGYNATQAALVAGYSESSIRSIASELLTNPNVKEFLEEYIKVIEEKLDITAEWKMKVLKECIEGCLTGQASEKKIHPTGVIGAIAELNKMQGHYAKVQGGESDEDTADKVRTMVEEGKKEF